MAKLQQGYIFDNRYQLLRKLGEGGYSEVWLVDDTKAGMELVLKIFLPDAQLDDKVVDIFRKEFKLVYNINHPNLLKYSSFEVCMGYPYLKMPYYCSGSAESLIGHCSEQLGWRYLCDVSGGLAFLHSRRPAIIHQDIKPANILIDGDNFIITDFGISSSVYSLFKGTNDRTVVQGTRPYMPPEKYLENPEIYVENDIWSLGASLYELLTGELPFGSKGGATQLEKIEIPELPATFSREMRYVIRKCLSINPSYRPTAKELAAFAKNQMDKKQVPPHRPPLPPSYSPYKTDDFYGQEKKNGYWILIAASCIVGMVLVVFFTIFLFNHIMDKDNPTAFKPETKLESDSQLTNEEKTDKGVIDYYNDIKESKSTKSSMVEAAKRNRQQSSSSMVEAAKRNRQQSSSSMVEAAERKRHQSSSSMVEAAERKRHQSSPNNKNSSVSPMEKKIKFNSSSGEDNGDSEGESSNEEFLNQHTNKLNYTSGKDNNALEKF